MPGARGGGSCTVGTSNIMHLDVLIGCLDVLMGSFTVGTSNNNQLTPLNNLLIP